MNRNIALDLLKLIMACMVVGLHAGFLNEVSELGSYLAVNGFFRIAVPIFFIINGFYFYPVLLKNNYVAWLKRVLILYVVWMVFYSYFWFFVPGFYFVEVVGLLQQVLVGYHHLWYLAGMLGAALILLAVYRFPFSLLVASVLVTFFCGVLIQYLGNYHILADSVFDEWFNLHWVHRNMVFFAYPFFCVGYLINKYSVHEYLSFELIFAICVVGFLVLVGESYVNYRQALHDGVFDNLLSLLLVCPFVFMFFLKCNVGGESKKVALYSSAIYFIHSLFLSIFRKYTEIDGTLLTLLTIMASVFSSYFIIKVNDKIKFIL